MAGEEPVRGPLAEPAAGHERGLDLLVGESREFVERRRVVGQAENVLRLAPREPQQHELVRLRAPQPLRRRERERLAHAAAEPLDQAAADRERGVERDLLRGDRGDERLERVRRQRGAEAGELDGELAQHGVAFRPLVERVELELRADELPDYRPRLRVERLDAHSARRRRDPHLALADHAVQSSVDPEVREVRPEGSEPLGRELEVERLRQAQQAH